MSKPQWRIRTWGHGCDEVSEHFEVYSRSYDTLSLKQVLLPLRVFVKMGDGPARKYGFLQDIILIVFAVRTSTSAFSPDFP